MTELHTKLGQEILNAKYVGNLGIGGWVGITAEDIRKFNYGCLSVDAYAGTKAIATGNSREAAIFPYAKDKVVP